MTVAAVQLPQVLPDESDQKALTAHDLALDAGACVDGLYLHIPFCFHKCHYCDFYSIVDQHDRQPAFVDRLIAELRLCAERITQPLATIFVGGGTPTLLAPELWRRLLQALQDELPLATDLEFTVEANPETVTDELAHVLLAGGVNRVSIGAQSFHPDLLQALERHHDPQNVGRSVRRFRNAGIDNINLDLIFAIPGETSVQWREDLRRALDLEPAHLSCYGLVYEPGTPLERNLRRGRVQRIDEAVEAEMYETALETLAAAGLEQYEISNWSRPRRECRHNLLYWRNRNWWPLGPGAAGHVDGTRWKNAPRLSDYLRSDGLPAITSFEKLDDDARLGEALMLGLRLREGVGGRVLQRALSESDGSERRRAAVDRHLASGLLEQVPGRLRLSSRGLLLTDAVLADLL